MRVNMKRVKARQDASSGRSNTGVEEWGSSLGFRHALPPSKPNHRCAFLVQAPYAVPARTILPDLASDCSFGIQATNCGSLENLKFSTPFLTKSSMMEMINLGRYDIEEELACQVVELHP